MKDVVTSILKNEGKILILKRSNKVGSFQGKWAGISGYVEKHDSSPLERAIIEIREETGLSENEIRFIKAAKPIEIRDGEVIWRVHAFLFEARKKEIKIDWEHSEYKWIELDEIKNYDVIPSLNDVIHALLEE
ncbi:MAG: NUDIX domain-containing protein [Thermoplasmata archaeon]|nr:NUDIX domain-containing protein [Thermoplasmata archaeon]